MLILNFSHPITDEQLQQIEELIGAEVAEVRDVPVHVDQEQPLASQVVALADRAGLSLAEWQSAAFVINPPALNFIAVAVLAELHGRCGYFPACLRLRPVKGSIPPRYEVAEVLNLQDVRDGARARRK
jgi:hypothetical protein